MSKRKKIILIVASVLTLFIVFKAVQVILRKPTRTEYLVPVKVIKPVGKDVEEIINLTGDVRGLSEAKVYSKVPGKLQKKKKDVGDLVSKNEVVALVDRDEPALKFKLSEVTSPLDGVITRYFMDIGETVEIGMQKTPIFEVASIDEVKVAASIAEKDITKVKKGLPVRFTVDAYPDKFFYGEVSRISQTIDLQSRTVQIEIFVSNKNGLLKPGMFAKVNIIVSTHKNALTIPVDAIGEFDSEKYVFVVINSIVHRKNIKTGISQNQDVEVLDGLTETDDVISVGWQNLTDKMQVEVIEK